MDFLKSQLDRIQQQLAGLNASQKMLATCLVAIIVMTVMWWGSYAGRSEMAPLFQEAMEPDEALRIVQQLSARGIKAEVGVENRVTVPSADLHRAFAELAVSESLPKDPSIDFDSFMKGLNPFASQKMGNAHLINFKAARLAEVIRQFPGVKGADVFIDPTDKFAFNGGAVHPSATVSIKVKDPKQFSQQLVDGAASMVLGAHAGLEWNHVTVMVNGSPRRVTDPETRGLDTPGLLATREDYQEKYAARVEKLLMIRGLSVSVTFGVNGETVRRKSRIYDKEKTLSKEVEIQEKTKESTGAAGAPAGEPGAQPNVGMSIAGVGAGGGESSYTETDTKTKLEVLPSVVDEDMVKTAGLGDPTGAAVMVPRSHVVAVLKHGKQNPPEPDDQQVEAWFAKELPHLQKMVKSAVGLSTEDQVSMALYTDLIPPQPAGDPGLVQPVGLSGSLTAMAGMHSREIVLGGLAVVSLFMVSMMVRKSSPTPVAVAASSSSPLPGVMPVLDASEVLAGEVSEGKSMLDAMELDEDAVRAQQMVEQVSSMVEENPDAAASLVKRWMSRT